MIWWKCIASWATAPISPAHRADTLATSTVETPATPFVPTWVVLTLLCTQAALRATTTGGKQPRCADPANAISRTAAGTVLDGW